MSFRQFGGLNYASKHNIVGTNYQTISNLQLTQYVGQPNSYINFLSDISGNISSNLDISGNLGVSGDTTLGGNQTINGNSVITGTLTVSGINVPSDYRIKDNIKELDDSFIVDNLSPITYNNKLTNKQDIGVIAHELQECYPYLVTGIKDDGTTLQTVNYNGLIGILINEIKMLKKELKYLKDELNHLK